MPSNDPSSDLDSRIAAIVENSVGRMRDELMHRLQDTESRLRSITGRLDAGEPAEPAPDAAPPSPAAAAAPADNAVSDLFEAIAVIDRGDSQQDVLAALLEGIGRFAGRSALFLTRADGAQGWGSYGFEDLTGEIQDVVLSYGEGPLAVLAEGRGCVELPADECRELCSRMGASPGAEGLLIPFVLRDRLAAALYADRFPDDPPLARQQLQLLAYVGALAVEGLTLRQRSETPTLQVADGAAAAPGVALWEAPAAAVETEPAAPEPQLPEPQLTEPQLTEPQLSEPPAAVSETLVEPPVEEVATELPDAPAASAIAAPPAPQPEPAAPEPAADDVDWELPEIPDDLAPAAPEPPPPVVEEPPQPLDSPTPPAPGPPAAEEPTAEPAWAAAAAGELVTPAIEPPSALVEPPPAQVEPPPARVEPPSALVEPATSAGAQPAASGTTEVRPPTDVSGPGWAFTASRAAAESSDDSQHEEARRLARLLVTEIKLYNEEQVEEGRRGKDIYARLREDIDRSRQIFNERVEAEVREQTDYFHEEMVRILAGGNEEALGL